MFEDLEDFLESLLCVKVFHAKSSMSGGGIYNCFGHILIVAHFT